MVTHDPTAAAYADRTLHLNKGVLQDGALPTARRAERRLRPMLEIPALPPAERRSATRCAPSSTLFGVMVAVGVFCLLASIETSMNRTIDRTAQSSLLVVTQKDQW